VGVPALAQEAECCGFAFTNSGRLPDPSTSECVNVNEPSDPDTWADNYFCGPKGIGLKGYLCWTPGTNLRCTPVIEPAEPAEHTWADNQICVPNASAWEFAWSYAGPIEGGGYKCIPWNEPSDPHTWSDNFLCVRKRQLLTTNTHSWPLIGGTPTKER